MRPRYKDLYLIAESKLAYEKDRREHVEWELRRLRDLLAREGDRILQDVPPDVGDRPELVFDDLAYECVTEFIRSNARYVVEDERDAWTCFSHQGRSIRRH